MKVLKLENLMPAQGDLIFLQKGLALKKCKDNRKSSFCQLEGSRQVLDTIKEITEKKGYLPDRF